MCRLTRTSWQTREPEGDVKVCLLSALARQLELCAGVKLRLIIGRDTCHLILRWLFRYRPQDVQLRLGSLAYFSSRRSQVDHALCPVSQQV